MISANFWKIPKNVSIEKISGRFNRISNDISGSCYARLTRRSDFDDAKICSKFWMARKTTSAYLLLT